MHILVDENIPRMTVQALRQLGHDVNDIRDTPFQGITDAALGIMAQQQKRLLITTDRGFAKYRHEAHQGILIIRLRPGLLVVMRDVVQSISRAERRRNSQ